MALRSRVRVCMLTVTPLAAAEPIGVRDFWPLLETRGPGSPALSLVGRLDAANQLFTKDADEARSRYEEILAEAEAALPPVRSHRSPARRRPSFASRRTTVTRSGHLRGTARDQLSRIHNDATTNVSSVSVSGNRSGIRARSSS